MATYTTPNDVQGILGKNYDGTTSLTPFIDTAHSYITRIIQLHPSTDLEQLELVERWLAAHFYAHADPLYTSKSANGASGSFQGSGGTFLDSTTYGQTAMTLDTTGYLAYTNRVAKTGNGGASQPKATCFWVGT